MAALDQVAGSEAGGLAVIAHHQVALLLQQGLRYHNQWQRAGADRRRQTRGGSIGGEVDHASHTLLLKREQAAFKAVAIVERLAEKDHVALLLQLQHGAGHHLHREAVAKVTQDQANQIRGIGPKIGRRHVVDVAEGVDRLLHLFNCGGRYLSFLAKHQRNGGDGDARQLRDINNANLLQIHSLNLTAMQSTMKSLLYDTGDLITLTASGYLPIMPDMVWAINCARAPKIT